MMHVADQRKTFCPLMSLHHPSGFFSASRIEILALKHLIIKALYVWANLEGTGLLQS